MNKLTKKLAIGAFALSLGISSTYAVSKSKHQHNHIDDTQLTNSASNLSIGKPSLQAVCGVGGLICNVISIGLSIAQLCKSGPAEQLKKMVNILNSINEKVDIIDSKLNEMMDQLTIEFTALQIEFNGVKIKEDLEMINDFDSTVLDRYLTQLKTSINRKFLDFSVASTYSYKDTYSADYGYFLGELSGKTGVNVDITGEEVKKAVEDANSEMSININNIEEWTILVGKKLLKNPTVESKLAPVLKQRQDSGFEDTTFISAFTSGFQDFLLDQ
ncbi:MAG: hypothetical protein MJ199_00400, partial [Bacilli bacterium]|nr:hypothetical protein [Bacilli bacterium]